SAARGRGAAAEAAEIARPGNRPHPKRLCPLILSRRLERSESGESKDAPTPAQRYLTAKTPRRGMPLGVLAPWWCLTFGTTHLRPSTRIPRRLGMLAQDEASSARGFWFSCGRRRHLLVGRIPRAEFSPRCKRLNPLGRLLASASSPLN